jgi:putative ABC transport system permease protein
MVVASGMRLVLLGAGAGLAASLVLGRALESFLFGVGSADPATLAAVAAVLVLVGFIACAIPARRAVRVDPVSALRYE